MRTRSRKKRQSVDGGLAQTPVAALPGRAGVFALEDTHIRAGIHRLRRGRIDGEGENLQRREAEGRARPAFRRVEARQLAAPSVVLKIPWNVPA
ncbi:MAG TPA: hypothetical protein VGL03_16535 [Thermoanaerobaculia bacterium]|jgi:hypothetical protein